MGDFVIFVLCLVGAMTIFYFMLCLEEAIMEKLTGEGIIGSLRRILNEIIK